jgi:protein-S-isoprenylcysteine O-methyltransferase Ste14
MMFILFRALIYATAFIGILLIAVPARLLVWAGQPIPQAVGAWHALGIGLTTVGALLIAWCIGMFVFVGRGTQAPFDPPRRLVIGGPYAIVRNPMYVGAVLAMSGAAIYCASWPLVAYAAVVMAVTHLFVVAYEEPTLRHTFGDDYAGYCARVGRWVPASTGFNT